MGTVRIKDHWGEQRLFEREIEKSRDDEQPPRFAQQPRKARGKLAPRFCTAPTRIAVLL